MFFVTYMVWWRLIFFLAILKIKICLPINIFMPNWRCHFINFSSWKLKYFLSCSEYLPPDADRLTFCPLDGGRKKMPASRSENQVQNAVSWESNNDPLAAVVVGLCPLVSDASGVEKLLLFSFKISRELTPTEHRYLWTRQFLYSS